MSTRFNFNNIPLDLVTSILQLFFLPWEWPIIVLVFEIDDPFSWVNGIFKQPIITVYGFKLDTSDEETKKNFWIFP